MAKQRYRKVGEEEIMIGSVCAKRIRELVATQMRVDLPLPLIAMEVGGDAGAWRMRHDAMCTALQLSRFGASKFGLCVV